MMKPGVWILLLLSFVFYGAGAYGDYRQPPDYRVYADADRQSANQRDNYRQLSKEQQEQLRKRREYYESLPPEEQEKIRRARERYEDMSPEQKQQVRKRWENMSQEERKQYRKWRKEQRDKR